MATTETAPRSNRTRIAFAIAVLIGAIILLVTVERASVVSPPESEDEPSEMQETPPGQTSGEGAETTGAVEPTPADGPTPHRAFAATVSPPPEPPAGAGVSPLADRLNHRDGSARQDLEIVGEIFANYLEAFSEMPVGTNAEITAALAGDNSRGHAPLAATSPAINAKGELVDRWGTPLFFHQMSAISMEVRSAGPDRQLYTPDDVLLVDGAVQDAAVSLAGVEHD